MMTGTSTTAADRTTVRGGARHTTQRRSRFDASGNIGLDLVQLDEALDVRSELPAVFRRSTGRVARILVLAIVWQVLGSL